jgi:hypothetical protein
VELPGRKTQEIATERAMQIKIEINTTEEFTDQDNVRAVVEMVLDQAQDARIWRLMKDQGHVTIEGHTTYWLLDRLEWKADFTIHLQ